MAERVGALVTVRLGIVTNPVPKVTGLLVTVLMERVVTEVKSMTGLSDVIFVDTLFKVTMPVPVLKVLAPVTVVAPFRETAPVPVEKVPVPVWEKLPEAMEIPVKPESAPPEDRTAVGVLMKLVKPVAEAKLRPLITLALVLVAALKLRPFTVLLLLALVPLAKVRL